MAQGSMSGSAIEGLGKSSARDVLAKGHWSDIA